MKCNNCGRELNNGSKFCPYCGVPVKKKYEKLWLILLVVAVFSILAGSVCFVASRIFGQFINNTGIGISSSTGESGTDMVCVNGVICNSAGAVNNRFKGAKEYEFYTDPEGTVGMIFVDGEVNLIDSGLNMTCIDKNCVDAVMNYTGKYIYVATSNSSELGKGLCVYNVNEKDYKLIEACDIEDSRCLATSPDGNTALVSREGAIFMMGADGFSEKIYDGPGAFDALLVSNDRKVAYFVPTLREGLFCWKEGNVIQFYDEMFWGNIAANSDCKKILFYNAGVGLNYFDSDTMSESKVVLSDSTFSALYKGKGFVFSDTDVNYFPGADSFEGMYITAGRTSFWLNADIDAVCKDEYWSEVCSGSEFKVYDITEKSINSITYKDGETKTEEVYHNDNGVYDCAVSDDGRLLWILLYDKIVTYKDGKVQGDAFKIPGDGFSVGCIKNDPLSDKAYCISDNGKVYMLDEKGNNTEIGTVKGAYGLYTDFSNGKEIVTVEDEDDNRIFIVHGKLIKKDDN